MRIFYIFAAYEIPFTSGMLKEKDCMRAIDSGAAPSDMPGFIISSMFDAILDPASPGNTNYMVFPQFALYWHIYIEFLVADSDMNNVLSLDGFKYMIDNYPGSELIRKNIDDFYHPTEDEVIALHAKLPAIATEETYLIHFL